MFRIEVKWDFARMERFYRFCGLTIRVVSPCFYANAAEWQRFEVEPTAADVTVDFRVAAQLPEAQGKQLGTAGDISVWSDGATVSRVMRMGARPGYVATYRPGGSRVDVCFTEESFPILTDDRYLWSTLCLAQLLLDRQVAFFHSSYIGYHGKGIIFCGPSGIGKSTQASLWESSRGATVINGDKSGVTLAGGARVHGVPVSGTSGISRNESLPLGAVVLPEQAQTNRVQRLDGAQALSAVMKNIYLDLLAPGERLGCIDFVLKLLSSVPVYRLCCTADGAAVAALEQALQGGGVV